MPKHTPLIQPTTTKYRFIIKTTAGQEVANSGNEMYNTHDMALQAARNYRVSNNLVKGYLGYTIPVETPVLDLYTQVRDYILGTWSKSCITHNEDSYLEANNRHLHIWFSAQPGTTPFLALTRVNDSNSSTLFNGYIRNIEDFKLLLSLTSVQKFSWGHL